MLKISLSILLIFLIMYCFVQTGFSQFFYHINDHLGNTRVVLDDQGNVKEYYDYYPFGKTLRSSVTDEAVATYKFTGKELDDENDLNWYYFGARYYDAEIGRWFSPDPLSEKFPNWSPYNFCLNNPLNNRDLDGQEVRFDDEEEARKVAEELNRLNKTEDAIGIEKVDISAKTIKVFGKTITLREGYSYYRLTVNPASSFDWGQNKVTTALKDVISSRDIVFKVDITETYKGFDIQGYGGGIINPQRGGADVYISSKGYLRKRETMGLVLSHEMLGHGHPVGSSFGELGAKGIQKTYGYSYSSHAGYHKIIGWKNWTKYPGVNYYSQKWY